MPTYVMRVWLADRPGALGEVATAVGAVDGDLIGIDILERGNGRAIDELTIELADEALIAPLIEGVNGVEGVDIEDIRLVFAGLPHPLVDAVEVAADLLAVHTVKELLAALVAGVAEAFNGWAAVVEADAAVVLAASAEAPAVAWLEAFVTGTRSASQDTGAAALGNDVAWAGLEVSGLALLVGRTGRPFRSRERRQLATVSRVADHRWCDLVAAEVD